MDAVACVGEEYEVPLMALVVETETSSARVEVNQHARLALPDTRHEADYCSNEGDGCKTFESMQATVRVPMTGFCQAGVVLDEAIRIRLEFSSPNPIVNAYGTLIILDDLELRRVPGEPAVDCRCG